MQMGRAILVVRLVPRAVKRCREAAAPRGLERQMAAAAAVVATEALEVLEERVREVQEAQEVRLTTTSQNRSSP